jgi:hypothetical protein
MIVLLQGFYYEFGMIQLPETYKKFIFSKLSVIQLEKNHLVIDINLFNCFTAADTLT